MGKAGQWQGTLHPCCGVGMFFFFSSLIARQNTLFLPGQDSASVGDVGVTLFHKVPTPLLIYLAS